MRILKNKKGVVLIIVMCTMSMVSISALFLVNMVIADVNIIKRVKGTQKSISLARAGLYHGLADIKLNGMDAFSTINGSLSTGTYVVTLTDKGGGRYLLSSDGTAEGVTRNASCEITSSIPSALTLICGAGNDLKIAANKVDDNLTGNIHANGSAYLKCNHSKNVGITITGKVSATNIVQRGTKYNQSDNFDTKVIINGVGGESSTVYEYETEHTFPTFTWAIYKDLAVDSGDYYSGSKTFSDEDISPGNGIVYVEGTVTFTGTCNLYGGVVAEEVEIHGDFTQYKTGDYNFLASRTGDVGIHGVLNTEEALVYAGQDIATKHVQSDVIINGVMLAKRDIDFWNVHSGLEYTHILTYPPGTSGEDGELFSITGWSET